MDINDRTPDDDDVTEDDLPGEEDDSEDADAAAAAEDADANADADADGDDDEPDPITELRETVAASNRNQEQTAAQVRSELGRVGYLQTGVEKAQTREAAEAQNSALIARLDDIEDSHIELLDTQIAMEIDDARVVQLTDKRNVLMEKRNDRVLEHKLDARERDRASIQSQPQPASVAPANDEWRSEMLKVQGRVEQYAADADVDPNDIPDEVWTTGGQSAVDARDPAKAFEHLTEHIDGLSKSAKSAERVSKRRVAAGNGTIQRNGAALDDEALADDYGVHPEKYENPADKQKVFDAMGRLGY